jgi:hypothetical protein
MPVKVTMQFTLGRASFTESHYSRTFSDAFSLGATTAALRLAGLRVAMNGNGTVLTRLRLSRTDIPRTVNNINLTGAYVATNPFPDGLPADDSDIPNVSVICSANDGAGHSKNLYLAGLPEASIELAGRTAQYFQFTGQLAAAFTAYQTELVANWNFRVSTPLAGAAQVNQLNNVIVPVPGVQLETSIPIPGVVNPAPFEVLLKGFRRVGTRSPGLSGIYDCVAVTVIPGPPAQYLYTLANTGNVNLNNFLRLGTIAGQAFTYVPYQYIAISKGGTRKRGGSAGLPRGRSKTRG